MSAGLIDETIRGVYIIAATPFGEDGALDLASADRMVEFYLDSGVSGMTILGVMGEAPKLTAEESEVFARHVLNRVAGRVPVVVGVSNPGNRNLAALAHQVMDDGAAGVMVAPITGLRTDEQVEGYLASVIKELGEGVPVILQDYPPPTGVYMSAPLVNRLFAAYPSLKVFKHEDCPGLRKISKLRAAEATGERRRIAILVGNGGLYLPQELRRGVDGANTGFAYPEMLVEVCRLFFAGDDQAAEDLYDAYLPLVRHEQQPGFGLAVRKEVLRRRGVIKSAATRAPGPGLDGDDLKELDGLLARLERRLGQLGRPAPGRMAA